MKITIPTDDLFRGQPILLEIEIYSDREMEDQVDETRRHWKKFMKEAIKYSMVFQGVHGFDVDPVREAAPELLEALIMVRDADNDRRSDGLETIPTFARHRIDASIAKAEGK